MDAHEARQLAIKTQVRKLVTHEEWIYKILDGILNRIKDAAKSGQYTYNVTYTFNWNDDRYDCIILRDSGEVKALVMLLEQKGYNVEYSSYKIMIDWYEVEL